MKIALITDGESEFRNLPMLMPQIQARSGNAIIGPMKVNTNGAAPAEKVARECESRIKIAKALGANLAVIILDREGILQCTGERAVELERAVARRCGAVAPRVVLKDRMFENWLIADLSALKAQPGRFRVTPTTQRMVEPNKADQCDALQMLKSMTVGDSYDKVRDSARICERMKLDRAALHSRSLRHLLHVVGDRMYAQQCRRPSVGRVVRRAR